MPSTTLGLSVCARWRYQACQCGSDCRPGAHPLQHRSTCEQSSGRGHARWPKPAPTPKSTLKHTPLRRPSSRPANRPDRTRATRVPPRDPVAALLRSQRNPRTQSGDGHQDQQQRDLHRAQPCHGSLPFSRLALLTSQDVLLGVSPSSLRGPDRSTRISTPDASLTPRPGGAAPWTPVQEVTRHGSIFCPGQTEPDDVAPVPGLEPEAARRAEDVR